MYLDNKYTFWYNSIISNAKNRSTNGYTETHHIIPRSLGGSNSEDNLVKLTAREHFICHLLLPKMTEGQLKHKMIHALWCMAMLTDRQGVYKIHSNTYMLLKNQYSQMRRNQEPWNKGVTGKVVQTPESNAKRSSALRGRPSPNRGNFGEKNPFYGKSHTKETREKIKESIRKSNRVPWNKDKKGLQVAWNKGKNKD